MKILAADREAAEMFNVSAYGVAQARELHGLSESTHPLAVEARVAVDAVFRGDMSLREAYKLVNQAKVPTQVTRLLAVQIDAELLERLKVVATERKQLFKVFIQEALTVYLMAVQDEGESETA